jgi:hypothetical protein
MWRIRRSRSKECDRFRESDRNCLTVGSEGDKRPLPPGSNLSRCFSTTEVLLVLKKPVFQNVHGRQEVVALDHHQVDGVEVFTATKAVRQIVAGVVRCPARSCHCLQAPS